ncbi:hypothetical protein DFH08DRAFT_801823 [Mycena albidolilacea]|uniref:Uncharacterized protein n=1 Tax=Mycena albidolilacea TaxID=1033008 RepID=A0AAD7AGA9_9AGAR|nr:hypothetical protein DFH08DRAFT_801823 [Mycena albidolilacea]
MGWPACAVPAALSLCWTLCSAHPQKAPLPRMPSQHCAHMPHSSQAGSSAQIIAGLRVGPRDTAVHCIGIQIPPHTMCEEKNTKEWLICVKERNLRTWSVHTAFDNTSSRTVAFAYLSQLPQLTTVG